MLRGASFDHQGVFRFASKPLCRLAARLRQSVGIDRFGITIDTFGLLSNRGLKRSLRTLLGGGVKSTFIVFTLIPMLMIILLVALVPPCSPGTFPRREGRPHLGQGLPERELHSAPFVAITCVNAGFICG